MAGGSKECSGILSLAWVWSHGCGWKLVGGAHMSYWETITIPPWHWSMTNASARKAFIAFGQRPLGWRTLSTKCLMIGKMAKHSDAVQLNFMAFLDFSIFFAWKSTWTYWHFGATLGNTFPNAGYAELGNQPGNCGWSWQYKERATAWALVFSLTTAIVASPLAITCMWS